MKIAFDAKRAFHNERGLGNYSRDTIRLLSSYYPENNYYLFNPKRQGNINFPLSKNVKEVLPKSVFGKSLPSLWRSYGMRSQIKSIKPDIYHGLSQELPLGINKIDVRTIVTIHDAIFMRYPQHYSSTYRALFIQKNKYACRTADRIIAISEQTKRDMILFFGANENKISVVYQGCNNIFREPISEETKVRVREKYNLPQQFLLNVGAIEERKNAALIIEALHRNRIDIPLIIIGKPTIYINDIKTLIAKYGLVNQVIFLHQVETNDLPAIYSLSEMFIYPSIFEGFGIPILEALCTETPVISSTGSCFEETGGPFSRYINPLDADELGESILDILNNSTLKDNMTKKGLDFSKKFTDQLVAQNLMNVYNFVNTK